MKRINFILTLLLLIGSCGQYENENHTAKKRSNKDLNQQIKEVKKTPEEELKEKLNEEEKINLEFLKEALDDENNFNKFLSHDESNIKSALKHINNELANCTGDNANEQKKTFKQIVKGSFESNSNDLDKFKEQTATTCGAGR